MAYITTIQENDIGKGVLDRGTKRHWISSTMGHIQAQDVGKRVYQIVSPSGYRFYQVESQEQLEART